MRKNISIISLNYYPEDTAIGLYSKQMADFLSKNGWNVTVLTGFPYYPQWEIWDGYKNKSLYLEEIIDDIRVLRYKQYVPSKPSFSKRVFHIIDFSLGSLLNLRKINQADIVLSIIPFTTSAWLGKKLAKKLDAKHWIHIQDFEFDAAFESGITSSRRFLHYFKKKLFQIESSLLNSADIVSTISNGMLKTLSSKTGNKQFFFPNWIDGEFIDPIKSKRHNLFNKENFNILYSGNIGSKQDWDFFLKIIEQFKTEHNIKFSVVGDGAMLKNLKEKTKGINNVDFYKPVPYKELNDLICSADLHILFQKKDVVDTVMPSKILAMMASQAPSIITGELNSETSLVIKKSEGGYFFGVQDYKAVCDTIRMFKNSDSITINIGSRARNYVIGNFSKETILQKFEQKLDSLLSE